MLRLLSYRSDHTASLWHAGIALGHALIDLAGYAAMNSRNQVSETHLSVRSSLSASQDEQEQILAWATRQFDSGVQVLSLDEVDLRPPVPDPEKILCLGLNYPAHAAEAQADIPSVPTFFAKFRNSLVGPTSPVILLAISPFIDYEGELVVVIGKRCKHVAEQEALASVAGYPICNDLSARSPDADQPVDSGQSH